MIKEVALIGLFAALYLLLPLAALGQESTQQANVRGPISLIPTDADLRSTLQGTRIPLARMSRTPATRTEARPQPRNPATAPLDGTASNGASVAEGDAILGRAAGTARDAASAPDHDQTDGGSFDPAAKADAESVRNLQAKLNALGYDAGPADGLIGPRTRDAIDAFRVAEGVDRAVDDPAILLTRATAIVETPVAASTQAAAELEPVVAEAPPTAEDPLPQGPVAMPPAGAEPIQETFPVVDGVQKARIDTAPSPADSGPPSLGNNPLNARELIGRVMTNDQGMKLGEVSNIVFERDGRVAGLLVRVGGFHLLGDTFASIIGEAGREIAVPWSEVKIDRHGRVLVDMIWSDVENAPTYDPDRATVAVDM